MKLDSDSEMAHDALLSKISSTSSAVMEYFMWLLFSSERYTKTFWFSSNVRKMLGLYDRAAIRMSFCCFV